MLQCKKCGSTIPDGAAVCPECGSHAVDTAVVICEYCGSPMKRGTRTCTGCGAPLPVHRISMPAPAPVPVQVVHEELKMTPAGEVVSDRNRWIAFLLAVTMGGFGIHRFYVGKIGTGILWMLTGGLGGIGWFVDAACILFGWFSDKKGRRLK